MLARRIKKFIDELGSFNQLHDFDQDFLKQITTQYAFLDNDSELNNPQLLWLLAIFEQRWGNIKDKDLDYTFDPNNENTIWVSLAQDLADDVEKNYLQILIPTIENTFDSILLNRLTDCAELRGFYLSEDGRTLHRVRGLYERLQKKYHFSTFRNPSDFSPIALTLLELYRLQAKQGDMPFPSNGTAYKNFWDYLKNSIIPTWRARGECPRSMLPSLLELVESYFIGPEEEFRLKFRQWEAMLRELPIEEINSLYGQIIQNGETPIYLVEILIATYKQNTPKLQEKMIAVARWIADQDPALISTRKEFKEAYRTLAVGPEFSVAELQTWVAKLDSSSELAKKSLDSLGKHLESASEIDQVALSLLHTTYKQHWLKVIGTRKDYTQSQTGINAVWIRLAQILSGAGLIKPNYYRFLMPTLTHDTDSVQKDLLTFYPINHYVLSEDGRQLILLDNSALRYMVYRTFYNCNAVLAKPFSKIELDRVAFAHKRFHKFLQFIRSDFELEDPPISLATVVAVKQLVDGSLYPTGLLYAHDYNETQMATAGRAYEIFYKFMHELPEDERLRLNAQRIEFHQRVMTVGEVLLKVKEGECIAVYGQYFAKLVMDYASWMQFRPEIETQVAIDEMRADSRKKLLRNYDWLSEEEALRRLQIIFVSLMTKQFQIMMFSGYTETTLGYTNIMPYEAKSILTMLQPMLGNPNFKDARSLYISLLEGNIKPAIKSDSFHTSITRYPDTTTWLKSIAEQTLFQTAPFYDADVFVTKLFPLTTDSSPNRKLEAFLEKVVCCAIRSPISTVDKLHINMKFLQFIKSLEPKEQVIIIDVLKAQESKKVEANLFNRMCLDFLAQRIAFLYAEDRGPRAYGMFRRQLSRTLYTDALKLLTLGDTKNMSYAQMQDALQLRLVDSVLPFCKDTSSSKIFQYWERITGKTLPTPIEGFELDQPIALEVH